MIVVSLILSASILAALGLFVLRAKPESPINRRFSIFTLLGVIWTVAIAGTQRQEGLELSVRLAFASGGLLPVSLLAFTQCYPKPSRARKLLTVAIAIGCAFSALSLATSLIVYDIGRTDLGLTRRPGPLYPAFALYVVATWIAAVVTFTARWRAARGVERIQLQYLGTAILIAGGAGLVGNLLLPLVTGQSTYVWVGPHFGLLFVVLVGHAVIRHRLMDLRVVIHRGLTISLAMALSLLPVVPLVVLFWPRLTNHLQPEELMFLIGAIVIAVLLVPVTRDIAANLLDRYVYRTHTNYQRTVRESSQALTQVLRIESLLRFLTDTIVATTETEGVAIYLGNRRSLSLNIADVRQNTGQFKAPDVIPGSVVDALTKDKRPMLSEAQELAKTDRATLDQLTQLDWALVLPVLSEDLVIGAIVLGCKRSGDPYYPQDLDLLTILANQAGIAIKNAQLYAEIVLANEYLQNIVGTIKSGVVAVNAAGMVTMFNRSAEQLTALAATDVQGAASAALPACLAAVLQNTLEDGQARTQPEIQLPGGTVSRPVICTTSPLRDALGRVVGAVAVFSDLTPLKELEVERRRAERLAYFEMLASGIGHEIKNPLVAIKTFAQLIPRRHGDVQFVEDFNRIVTREIAQMERLVERLGALARPSDRPLHLLDVRTPILEAAEFLQPALEEKRIVIRTALGPHAVSVLGDHGQLKQLFLNLLMNAQEATPPDGSVTIEISTTNDGVTVAMTDTGPGIPPDLFERIFDPFFTTRQRGSGLGLAICAGIAAAHRARLRAGNAPGAGARFTIEFPVGGAVPAAVPA